MAAVQEYLSQATAGVLSFLDQRLPRIGGEDWWQERVIDKLSESQAKTAEQKNFSSLSNFDLAALLNVLERNWRAITDSEKGLDYRRDLNLIIEAKNIRNHYAHEPSIGTPLEQQARDVQSIMLLLKSLSADADLIERGQTLYRELMLEVLGVTAANQLSVNSALPVAASASQPSLLESSPKTSLEPSIEASEQKGVPLHWLKAGTILEQELLQKIGGATYVGIDFGTSTSVASIAAVDVTGKGLHAEAIEICQLDELGREIHSHLVDSCLAWFNQKLLFGIGAARLKQELLAGQTIWTSFKMGLGVDIGPEYNRTALPDGRYEYTIDRPQHAAAVFLKLLCNGIKEYVKAHNLPETIYYTVTVPASFEANQRKDLFAALEFAGIAEGEIRLMDEPNAAFLSYLIDMESRSSDGRFVDALQSKNRNVIVFDFGAGTCDISILEVSVSHESILSRNLGISKFWALGGDDIDKVIAEKILLPQLCGAETLAKYLFTTTQLEQQVLPYLKPLAESLKIACCELAEQKGWRKLEDFKHLKNKLTTKPGKPFEIQGETWQITEPQITLEQFADVMALFVGQRSSIKNTTNLVDILQPIDNALEKVELTKNDIDMVLFIGGSCENPIIRHYVSNHLGRFVEAITPRDLRAHVSQGAALYTLLLRGADIDPIRPITSETIYVMTSGQTLAPVIRAGSLVPSEGALEEELIVGRDGQKVVELPFYSGSINKPLGLMKINSEKTGGFKRGDAVKIKWKISKEKILHVEAEVAGASQSAEFQNPLANAAMTDEVLAMLKSKQAFNKSVLEGNGRPGVNETVTYSKAAQKAGYWRLAAEMLEAAEKLDKNANHAVSICYCYSQDGDTKSSRKWAEVAYKRRPTAISAYNLALDKKTDKNYADYELLMEESLQLDPKFISALVNYGAYLMHKGDPRGMEYLNNAYDYLKANADVFVLSEQELSQLQQVSRLIGKDFDAAAYAVMGAAKPSRAFDENNLASKARSLGDSVNDVGSD